MRVENEAEPVVCARRLKHEGTEIAKHALLPVFRPTDVPAVEIGNEVEHPVGPILEIVNGVHERPDSDGEGVGDRDWIAKEALGNNHLPEAVPVELSSILFMKLLNQGVIQERGLRQRDSFQPDGHEAIVEPLPQARQAIWAVGDGQHTRHKSECVVIGPQMFAPRLPDLSHATSIGLAFKETVESDGVGARVDKLDERVVLSDTPVG
jgi:hypothetical protein